MPRRSSFDLTDWQIVILENRIEQALAAGGDARLYVRTLLALVPEVLDHLRLSSAPGILEVLASPRRSRGRARAAPPAEVYSTPGGADRQAVAGMITLAIPDEEPDKRQGRPRGEDEDRHAFAWPDFDAD